MSQPPPSRQTADPAETNRLRHETSPYLLQHADNPVHWLPWGKSALDQAQSTGKPILLSVGYAACHWCHVMAHESFENPDIAEVMNQHFVNIKVDREERPDIDIIYQSALALMGGQGGWPLTMFLTPDGEPFWGGTYFPPTARYGRPGFVELLRGIAEIYQCQPDRVAHNVSTLREALATLSQPPTHQGEAAPVTPDSLLETAEAALSLIDHSQGGLEGAPKFPQPTLFQFLWRQSRRHRHRQLADAVTTTLNRICQGGIYDHLAGGFARYSTDVRWLAPHFEKMAYDNGLLMQLLGQVWRATGDRLLATRLRETAEWTLRELWCEVSEHSGAFASSFDADVEGIEGVYYVWSAAEVEQILGADAARFKEVYDVSTAGNWENSNILNLLNAPVNLDSEDEFLVHCRQRLLRVRQQRPAPLRDDKILADWNGLVICGLIEAALSLNEPRWLAAATTAFRFICTEMSTAGRLRHSWRLGQAQPTAMLDDYANMAAAALALFHATQDMSYLAQAESWVASADRHYWDDQAGGYFFTADDAEALITRTKPVADNATPSGNGVLLQVLAKLFALTGNDHYRQRAEHLVALFAAGHPAQMLNLPSLLSGFDLLFEPLQVAIIGQLKAPDTTELIAAVHRNAAADPILLVVAPGSQLPTGHPAALKAAQGERATAYVCRGQTCLTPETDPQRLSDLLASAASPT